MKIVGVALVRNEEIYIGRVLRAALHLCDDILVLDNGSVDGTRDEVRRVIAEHPGRVVAVELHNLVDSHLFLQQYVGTDTWVFGVDGDEIYDPAGLSELREVLLGGAYADKWMVRAKFLHVSRLQGGRAYGYMSPPSHDPSKLYNFSLLEAWPADDVRPLFLPRAGMRFKAGGESYYENWETCYCLATWGESIFRCLHMKFLQRSRIDAHRNPEPRPNPIDATYMPDRIRPWDNYQRGPEVSVSVAEFTGMAS